MSAHKPAAGALDAFAAEGSELAARGRAIAEEATAVLADALAAVLADEAELAALHPASARDAVDFLVRLGRLGHEKGEAIVRRAGGLHTSRPPAR